MRSISNQAETFFIRAQCNVNAQRSNINFIQLSIEYCQVDLAGVFQKQLKNWIQFFIEHISIDTFTFLFLELWTFK